MKNTVSITRNNLFKKAYNRGASHANSLLALYVVKNKTGINRLGLTVSKKVGCAVVRNRVRRLIKENYRLCEDTLKKGFDIVIVSRTRAANADFHQIKGALAYLLKKAGLIREETP